MVSMNNYTIEELKTLLGSVGPNVNIHRSVEFFNPKKIHLGSNIRIDCFCLLSAGQEGIYLCDYIHIGAATHIFGGGGKVTICDYANISSRVSLFTSNDDYSGQTMTNPMVDTKYKNVTSGSIFINKHVIIGCGSIILPNVEINIGGAVGALSLVKTNVNEFEIVAGTPAKVISQRKKDILLLEKDFLVNK